MALKDALVGSRTLVDPNIEEAANDRFPPDLARHTLVISGHSRQRPNL